MYFLNNEADNYDKNNNTSCYSVLYERAANLTSTAISVISITKPETRTKPKTT